MKLVGKKSIPTEVCYDLSVRKNHNFFANGICVHNTNSCIGYNFDTGELFAQSRERILSYEADNAGFYVWVMSNKEKWVNAFKAMYCMIQPNIAYLYGEWFGANIQKGVAVSQLSEKKFGAFEMVSKYVNREVFDSKDFIDLFLTNANVDNTIQVRTIVPATYVTIDYNDPAAVQNTLYDLTIAVENECPVGKFFGVSGIGEGVVLTAVDAPEVFLDMPKIKCKGEKHSVTKVHSVKELTAAEIASKKNAQEFVDYALTENRLEQGWAKLEEMGMRQDITSLGAFLKWISGDIIKECEDVLVASMIDRKVVMKPINERAKAWFMKRVAE